MSTARFTLLSFALLLALASAATRAQSPAPIVVQAASPATATSTTAAVVAKDADSIQAAIKTLQQIKAANQEILTRQKATLETIGDIEEAAEQLKIFAKRG